MGHSGISRHRDGNHLPWAGHIAGDPSEPRALQGHPPTLSKVLHRPSHLTAPPLCPPPPPPHLVQARADVQEAAQAAGKILHGRHVPRGCRACLHCRLGARAALQQRHQLAGLQGVGEGGHSQLAGGDEGRVENDEGRGTRSVIAGSRMRRLNEGRRLFLELHICRRFGFGTAVSNSNGFLLPAGTAAPSYGPC